VSTVTPGFGYAVPTWADPAAIAAAAIAAMRLPAGDPDIPRVEPLAEAALMLIDGYLGNPLLGTPEVPVTPAPIIDAAILVTVELYRRKDAAFGVLNAYSGSDFGPVRISTDWLKGVESTLHPYMRDSFGVG
jgi:hypothetical protein